MDKRYVYIGIKKKDYDTKPVMDVAPVKVQIRNSMKKTVFTCVLYL